MSNVVATKIKQTAAQEPDDRAALRQAITARESAKHDLKIAEAAVGRGKALLDAALGQATKYDDVELEIAEHRAAAIKQFATCPGSDQPNMTLPGKLVERQRAKREVGELVAAHRDASRQLDQEVEACKRRMLACEIAVREKATSVINEFAEELAGELFAAYHRMRELSEILDNLGFVLPGLPGEPPSRPVQFTVSGRVKTARTLRHITPGGIHDPPWIDRGHGTRWRQWWDRLVGGDATATIDFE